MKLQINTSGAWRNVVEFDADRGPEVEDAAASLARALRHMMFRVIDDDGKARWLTEHGTFRALRTEGAQS